MDLLFDESAALFPPRRRFNGHTLQRDGGKKALRRSPSTPATSDGGTRRRGPEDILTLFPALDGSNLAPYGPVARRTLTANEAKVAREVFVATANDQAPKRRSAEAAE